MNIKDQFKQEVRDFYNLEEHSYFYEEIDGFLDNLDVESLSELLFEFFKKGYELKE